MAMPLSLVMLFIAVTTAVPVAARLCSGPLDVGGTTQLPDSIASIKARDDIAYPAHVTLATALEAANCSSTAVGLQWIKAAAHARSVSEVDQVARGLDRVRQHSPDRREFEVVLCGYLGDGFARVEQEQAVRTAGMRCPAAAPHSGS